MAGSLSQVSWSDLLLTYEEEHEEEALSCGGESFGSAMSGIVPFEYDFGVDDILYEPSPSETLKSVKIPDVAILDNLEKVDEPSPSETLKSVKIPDVATSDNLEKVDEPSPLETQKSVKIPDVATLDNIEKVEAPNTSLRHSLHSCKECGKELSTKGNLARHRRVHTGKLLKCETCERTYRDPYDLKRHQKRKHEQLSILHECRYCDKKFVTPQGLLAHVDSHEGRFAFNCDKCHRGFQYKTNFEAHLFRHEGIKPHGCFKCGKHFTLAGDRDRHYSSCVGLETFKCDICTKEYKNNKSLKDHKLVHLNREAFMCHHCGKLLTHSSSLRKHIKCHES